MWAILKKCRACVKRAADAVDGVVEKWRERLRENDGRAQQELRDFQSVRRHGTEIVSNELLRQRNAALALALTEIAYYRKPKNGTAAKFQRIAREALGLEP